MKINIKILSLVSVVGLGLLSSCNKNLDLNPVSTISDGNYWKTADQFDSFVSGLHARFRNHERAFVLLGEYQGEVFGNDPGTTSSFTGEAPQGVEECGTIIWTSITPGSATLAHFTKISTR